jgi:hypothetical protein
MGEHAGLRRGEKQFYWETLKGNGHLIDLGVEGRIILKWILKKYCESVDCIQVANDRA